MSGDIVIDGLAGDITLNSVSGELAVRNHCGRIVAHTVSGDITATGDVLNFTSDGVSGDVFLDVQGEPDDIRINTVSGNITTRLANGYPAQYTVNTVSGSLQLDENQINGVRGSYSGRYGTLDHNWLDFRANTVVGNIAVLHAAPAETPAS